MRSWETQPTVHFWSETPPLRCTEITLWLWGKLIHTQAFINVFWHTNRSSHRQQPRNLKKPASSVRHRSSSMLKIDQILCLVDSRKQMQISNNFQIQIFYVTTRFSLLWDYHNKRAVNHQQKFDIFTSKSTNNEESMIHFLLNQPIILSSCLIWTGFQIHIRSVIMFSIYKNKNSTYRYL